MSGDYKPEKEVKLPVLDYIDDVSKLHNEGRYKAAMQVFLAADGHEANLAKKVVAGYVSYAFHRVGEVTETIDGIDRIMGMGFNWAPPSVLVDTLGIRGAVELIQGADLPVPEILADAAKADDGRRFFNHPQINVGRFFVAG